MYHDSTNFLLKIYAGTIQRVKTIQVIDNIDLSKEENVIIKRKFNRSKYQGIGLF